MQCSLDFLDFLTQSILRGLHIDIVPVKKHHINMRLLLPILHKNKGKGVELGFVYSDLELITEGAYLGLPLVLFYPRAALFFKDYYRIVNSALPKVIH